MNILKKPYLWLRKQWKKLSLCVSLWLLRLGGVKSIRRPNSRFIVRYLGDTLVKSGDMMVWSDNFHGVFKYGEERA